MRKPLICGLAVAAVAMATLAFAATSACAAIIVSDGSQEGNRNNWTGTMGTQFTTGASDVVINALGFEDPDGSGLGQAHQVGLWDSSGTSLLGES